MDIREIVKSRASGLGEKVYCHPNIPKGKLDNTVSGITGNSCSADDVIAVLDTTVFGACDDGLAFTDQAMFFKALFKSPICVPYAEIGSVKVQGMVLKELVICNRGGAVIRKIEAENFKAAVAADILNSIVEAREEEIRRAALKKGQAEGAASPALGEADFARARNSLALNGVILIVAGIFLLSCAMWWWAIPAIGLGIGLLVKHSLDVSLPGEGMPIDVYCADTKDIIFQAWGGTIIVIGVLAVPLLCGFSKKRLTVIRSLLTNLKVIGEERLISLYLQSSGKKDDKLARPFVNGYIDWLEEQGKVIRIEADGNSYVFDPDHLERVMERVDEVARSDVRVERRQMIDGVKKLFDEDDRAVEALVNLPETGVVSYTFDDGIYYVHGINRDRVQICPVCGVAELANDSEKQENAQYFCSDYCRKTEQANEELIASLRAERFKRESVNDAAFGASLHGMLRSLGYDYGNVASFSDKGHGVGAENANTRIDKLLLRNAKVVGGDNAKDGADRIVDGVEIQSKYCKTAAESVNAAFDDKGQYRYLDKKGHAMQLEVPRDQYEKAVAEMRSKFHDGKLPPDIKSEADAEKLVRKGHLSYDQARNLCKFGTIESLMYDSWTGVIVGASAGGISFIITTALTYYQTRDLKKSLRASLGAGLRTGGKVFAVYVLAAQAQRTEFVKAFIHNSKLNINFGGHGKFVDRIGKGLHKMGGARGKINQGANVAVRGAIVTAAATFAVTSAWEVGKLCCGRMSGMQCVKNITVSGAGIASGTAGALIGGALLAPIPGGVFIGGLLGGMLGGMLGGSAAKAGMDRLIKDDSFMIMALVTDEFKIIAAMFCLNDDEIKKATEELDRMVAEKKDFVEDIFSKKKYRRNYVARLLHPIFIRICMERPLLFDKDISSSSISAAVSLK